MRAYSGKINRLITLQFLKTCGGSYPPKCLDEVAFRTLNTSPLPTLKIMTKLSGTSMIQTA